MAKLVMKKNAQENNVKVNNKEEKKMKHIAETEKELREMTKKADKKKMMVCGTDAEAAAEAIFAQMADLADSMVFRAGTDLPEDVRTEVTIVSAEFGYIADSNLGCIKIRGDVENGEVEITLFAKLDVKSQQNFGFHHARHILYQLKTKEKCNMVGLVHVLNANKGKTLTVTKTTTIKVNDETGEKQSFANYIWA